MPRGPRQPRVSLWNAPDPLCCPDAPVDAEAGAPPMRGQRVHAKGARPEEHPSG
jgi:hypothetical protein